MRSADSILKRRYIETSALLAALLEGDEDARKSIRQKGQCVTSALTIAEAKRALVRARVEGRITARQMGVLVRSVDAFQKRCFVIAISEDIITTVGKTFPVEPVRTLDALHLSTIQAIEELPDRLTVVTRDHRVCDNALAMGFRVE